MSFLAPLFLAAAAAVSLPILFHLIRRTPRGRQIFSSLMFLQPSPPRLTKKKRLENWPLLLLRVLALVLLALAFARPFLRGASEADRDALLGRSTVVLIDTSASMRRAGVWEDAMQQANELIDEAGPGDRLAVFAFDRDVRELVTFEQWSQAPPDDRAALAREAVDDLSPSWRATDLGAALVRASDTLEELAVARGRDKAMGPRRVVLISDAQHGATTDALRGYDWRKDVTLELATVASERAGNASAQWVRHDDSAEDKALRLRVTNAPGSATEQFELRWRRAGEADDEPDPITSTVYVPPGESRVVKAPPAAMRDSTSGGASGGKIVRVEVAGDDHDFDNDAWRAAPQARRATVVYIGGEDANDPTQGLFFLQRAYPTTERLNVRVEAVRGEVALTLDGPFAPGSGPGGAQNSPVEMVVVTEPMNEAQVKTLRAFVEKGHTALVVLSDDAVATTAAQLLGLEDLSTEPVAPPQDALLVGIDFDHPVFAPLAEAQFSDFSKVRFARYHRVDMESIEAKMPKSRALARFDTAGDDPALIEAPLGRGHVVILTSTWRQRDSQLALSTKFVPMMLALLERSMGVVETTDTYHVGDRVPLVARAGEGEAARDDAKTKKDDATEGTVDGKDRRDEESTDQSNGSRVDEARLTVTAPDGRTFKLGPGATHFDQADMPGVYAVNSEDATDPPWRFAVNLDPRESDVTPVSADLFESLGVTLDRDDPEAAAAEAKRQADLLAVELEQQHKIWRWLIVAALAVLGVETWLAGRYSRLPAAPSAAPDAAVSTGTT